MKWPLYFQKKYHYLIIFSYSNYFKNHPTLFKYLSLFYLPILFYQNVLLSMTLLKPTLLTLIAVTISLINLIYKGLKNFFISQFLTTLTHCDALWRGGPIILGLLIMTDEASAHPFPFPVPFPIYIAVSTPSCEIYLELIVWRTLSEDSILFGAGIMMPHRVWQVFWHFGARNGGFRCHMRCSVST